MSVEGGKKEKNSPQNLHCFQKERIQEEAGELSHFTDKIMQPRCIFYD